MNSVDRAVQKLGIQHVPDINSPDIPAAHTASLDVIQDNRSHRNSAFLAFLPPKLSRERRSHLKICTNTTVCRIELVMDKDGVRATGVHIETTNSRKADFRYVAKARREVVLCAGAIGSPQVLMLRYEILHIRHVYHVSLWVSGIGPKAHLEEKGVPVVLDVPAVGSYLVSISVVYDPRSVRPTGHSSITQVSPSRSRYRFKTRFIISKSAHPKRSWNS